MKTKTTKIKNPFDIMDEEQVYIFDQKPQNNINPNTLITTGKVHNPLPFNPFENFQTTNNALHSSKQIKLTQTSTYSNIIKQTKKKAIKSKSGFTNPFVSQFQTQQEEIILNQTQAVKGFNPQNTPEYRKSLPQSQQQKQYTGPLNEDGDPPLLEDIGIDIQLIKKRILMTIKADKPEYEQLQSTDLAGPILIALAFGCLLLLSGKIHFGDIYAMFLFGNSIMYFLINFMNQSDVIPLYNIMSTLGYSLLPMLTLGLLGIVVQMKGTFGIFLSLFIAFWSSLSAGNTLEVYLRQPHNNRKVLIVYPLFLFYLCFVMIVVF